MADAANVESKGTSGLIAASRVTGTNVYNKEGKEIGSVQDLMIDKRSGNITYAIISFGGFLGLGTGHYPLPWKAFKYDMGLGGYVTEIIAPQLQGAPSHPKDSEPDWTGGYESRTHDYYNSDKFARLVVPYPNSL
jgi:sporulation protein YlmC with PRC-barrel domain